MIPPRPPESLPDPTQDFQAGMFRAEWARRVRRQRRANVITIIWLLAVTLCTGLALWGLVRLPSGSMVAVFPVYFLSLLFFSLFTMVNYRCPRCNKSQNRLRNPRFCFNCGLQFRE